MGRIENYDNDSGISTFDRLFGTSYEGIVDGRPVYKTKNYLMGEIISKVTSEVASAGDRWDLISYKFSDQDVYDLGTESSSVLELQKTVGTDKYWILIPGVVGKAVVVSKVVIYNKIGNIPFDTFYTAEFLMYTNNPPSFYVEGQFRIGGLSGPVDAFNHFNIFSGPGDIGVGSPLILRVYNSSTMNEGNGGLGIWIEYKYVDFNLDFNG